MSTRAAIYLRVSKSDGSQSTDNQRPEVEQLARARGFEVVRVYEEHPSALSKRALTELPAAVSRVPCWIGGLTP
jgi:DNA invertase Pin-like site-specific DNA recombinase